MAVSKKKNSVLGKNPLTSQSIFTKTIETTSEEESRTKNQESRFLMNLDKEKVNLRLPIEINDWLDDLVKQGKRLHGSKVPKEIWVQAALELFQTLPIPWGEIDSVETLQMELNSLESRIKNL